MAKYLRYKGEFLSRASVVWRVEILQDADAAFASVGDLTFEADEALTIEWPHTDKEDVICGSSAILRIESPGDRTYEDLYTIEAGRIRMDVYRNGALYWSGALDPEFYEEPYEKAAHYVVTLTFSDFGILDRLKYDLDGMQTFSAIVDHALGKSQINYTTLDAQTYCSTLFTDDTKADISKLSVRSDNFIDEDGETGTLKEAVEGILQPLALRMVQRSGKIYIYDLNGLYQSAESRAITWSGDEQTLGVDKVANNIKVTFSPYATSDSLSPDAEFGGTYEDDWVSISGDVQGDVTYYSFYPDYSDEHRVGGSWDYDLINFTIFTSTQGSGLAYTAKPYFHIEPAIGGPATCDGISWQFATGHYAGPAITMSKGSSSVVCRTNRVFIPKLSTDDAARYYVRINLEMLLDARYNPFTEADNDGNNDSVDKAVKVRTAWAFVPVGITLYDAAGAALCHYVNNPIAQSAALGALYITKGAWSNGAASYGDAWLEYYDVDDQKDNCGIRGWKGNRQCIGRPDHSSRKNTAYGCGTGFYIYDSFKKMDDGQYIPYPSQGGYLEVTLYTGVRCFDYGEDGTFDQTKGWDEKSLYNKMRWLLYKAPKIEVVRNNTLHSAASIDDVEYSGYINKAAKDDISIDTICGTAAAACPTARGVICRASTSEQLTQLKRQGVTDHPERLLIGTMYSQYADRKTTLSGEADIDTGGLCTYTERNQQGKKFLLSGELQDCITDTSEVKITELRPDEYQGIEENN